MLLVVIALLLVGCDLGGNAVPPPSSPSGAATATTVENSSPTVEGQVGTPVPGAGPRLNPEVSGKVTFWHFWSSPVRRTAIRRIVALCSRELPNITIDEVAKPFPGLWEESQKAVEAGSGMPDVIVEDRPQLGLRAQEGYVQSLQARAERDGLNPDNYWPFTWEQSVHDGELYGVPYETDVRVLFYNKNAFKEAGLNPESPPKTWEELWATADKLDKKNPDGTYERIAFFPLIKVGPDVWGYTNGVEWVTEDGQPTIHGPNAVETLDWIKRWVDRYGGWQNIQNFRAQFQAAPNDEFMSGKVAMIADHNGYSSQLNFFNPRVPVTTAEGKTENQTLDWGVSDLPYNADKGSWSGGMALSIPSGAKNADAAWEFIKCATGPEAQASWARDTYSIPGNQEAARDPSLVADPKWQFFVDAMSYTTGGNYLPEYPNWGEQLSQRYEKVWTGELSADQALKQAQEAVEAEVQK